MKFTMLLPVKCGRDTYSPLSQSQPPAADERSAYRIDGGFACQIMLIAVLI